MSGRSAHVRKKINDPKTADKAPSGLGRGRANSSGSGGRTSSREDYATHDNPLSPGTGYGTTNARLLKFSEPIRESDFSNYRPDVASFSNPSSGSQSGGSDAGKGDAQIPRYQGPMPDFAYARVRKPVLKTEDVSGIERSGFRSAVDKKSEEVRRGITKAFSFGSKKKKKDEADLRSPSSIGSRQYEDFSMGYDMDERPSLNRQLTHPSPTTADMEQYYMGPPPPSTKLPAIPQPSAPPIKRWIGAGRPVQRWNKLRKDPELWDPNGDVLVYFGHKGQTPRPNPSFRLSSHIIEATESRFLITLLREGSTDDEDIHMQMPPSPIDASPMGHRRVSNHLGPGYNQMGQPTPPISDDTSLAEADGQISYEMYFPTPSNMDRIDAHRHAITTRNVFALLYHASLVGLSLYQALSDLLGRLESYMPQEADNVGTILNYLSARGIDDPRNNPETAVSILAWSETPEVRWEEGWTEAFVHCAGMYPRLELCADYKSLTPITRALLERSCLETQLRVQAAEGRLTEFAYPDLWPPSGPVSSSPSRAAADRLQKFFVAHYAAVFGAWPPPQQQSQMASARTAEGEELWLTRTVALKLARDFGALYDYLVNRDVVWDESEFRSGRKWILVSKTDRSFDADTTDLPITDLLIEFDNRQRFPHIPHPYPLVPESIVPSTNNHNNSSARSLTGREKGKKSDKATPIPTTSTAPSIMSDERTLERRVQLAYTEATNIYTLGSEFTHTELIDAFVKFEKTDHHQVQNAHVDPFAARRGRWCLIYGVLQTLASVSVDAPCVRYRGPDVAYHLSPRLRGSGALLNAKIPPWKTAGAHAAQTAAPGPDAVHELSHCWTAPVGWRRAAEGGEGGRGVASSSYMNREGEGGGGGGDGDRDGGRDAVLRMMRSQVQRFPGPPQSQLQIHTQMSSSSTSSSHFRTQQNRSGHHFTSSPSSPPLPPSPWNNANAYSPTHGPFPAGGAWNARNFKPPSSAISISARSDDTTATGFSSSNRGGNNRVASGSVSGETKPRSVRSYATFGHGRSAHPHLNQHPPLSFALSTTTTATSSSSVPDDGNTAVDDAEWPVRTHSFVYDRDSMPPPAPPPNRPLPLPLPLAMGARSSSAAASSSLTSMMAAAANRGIAVANADTDDDVDDDDDDDDGEGDDASRPLPSASPRMDGLLDVDHRDARSPLIHRRMSSDALGHVIRDLGGMGITPPRSYED